MRGYEVVTSDDRRVGNVVDVRDGYLIVESGRLRKSRHPVPREFVHIVDRAAKAFVTVPRRVLMDAPQVDRRGRFDRQQAAWHFGLAEPFARPPTEGEIRKHLRPGYADEHRHPSTTLFGDRRIPSRPTQTPD